ncbi:pilin N-terminal domain-containing protein [Enterococcus sp. DIV0800]|uniref:pilin N-terminal domain-containing protein n=1 Tax=unclassified Enterococcus TaxID=2608891 RepID=UPI003D2FC698
MTAQAATAVGVTNIVLHHKNENQAVTGTKYLVYDATNLYQEWLLTGRTPDMDGNLVSVGNSGDREKDQKALVTHWHNFNRKKALDFASKHLSLAESGELQLNSEGTARLTLQNVKDGKSAAYLLIETNSLNTKVQSAPLMLVMPVLNDFNEPQMEVDLYLKDADYQRDPYFYKFAKNLDGTEAPLAGAEFVLYRFENGQRFYLTDQQTAEENHWRTSGDPLSDTSLKKYQSDANGLVLTDQLRLSAGTYYFEEVKTASGYEINQASKAIKVIIPDSWDQSVTIADQEMEERVAGTIPSNVQKLQRPRIYNQQSSSENNRGRLPNALGYDSSYPSATTRARSNTTSSRRLPSTGEAKMTISFIGFLLVMMIIMIWKRRITGGDGNEKNN